MSKIAIIGAGFSGLSAACYAAAAGNEVHIFEKNKDIGGRARQFSSNNGYTFDMGPSWYWMPDVFERFFSDFGYTVKDFYELVLLNPSFKIVWSQNEDLPIPANYDDLCNFFESIEPGSAIALEKFMEEAQYKYETGMQDLVYMPGLSLTEFANKKVIKGAVRLQIFSSFSKHVRKFFKDERLIALMEFPVLFLGAMPQDTPALYSLMNYAGLKLGTWYPMGGFGKVIDAMAQVAKNLNVVIHTEANVEKILVNKDHSSGLLVNGANIYFDGIIAAADYAHVEEKLLPKEYRNYTSSYWEQKTFAPSCLIYYLGINKKLKNILHHTLFFEEKLEQHSIEIYKNPAWPTKPLFYACCPSVTDASVAPEGHENIFLLMPIAPGLPDDEKLREPYFNMMIKRLEANTGESIEPFIDYKKSYCINDFILDYNAFKGNAYGLANTLMQTAILKPKIKNKKIKNLFYAGQLTVPGPGVPPSIISGKVSAGLLLKQLNKKVHEAAI